MNDTNFLIKGPCEKQPRRPPFQPQTSSAKIELIRSSSSAVLVKHLNKHHLKRQTDKNFRTVPKKSQEKIKMLAFVDVTFKEAEMHLDLGTKRR